MVVMVVIVVVNHVGNLIFMKNIIDKIEIISIELTYNCNMECSWCFNNFSIFNNEKIFINSKYIYSFLLKILIIREKIWLKSKIVILLTWGEPLLHPDIKNIVYFIDKLKQRFNLKLKINTNWLLAHSRNKTFWNKIDTILYSYNFYDNETKNNSLLKIKNLTYLKHIFKWQIFVSSRLNKELLSNLEIIVAFYKANNLTNFILWFPLDKEYDNIFISQEEWKIFIDNISYLTMEWNLNIKVWNLPAWCFFWDIQKVANIALYNHSSNWMDRIVLNPKWIINPFYYYYSNDYNTYHNYLDILKYFSSKYFKIIWKKEWLTDKCVKCIYLNECNWWNRIISYNLKNDFFWIDPYLLEVLKK